MIREFILIVIDYDLYRNKHKCLILSEDGKNLYLPTYVYLNYADLYTGDKYFSLSIGDVFKIWGRRNPVTRAYYYIKTQTTIMNHRDRDRLLAETGITRERAKVTALPVFLFDNIECEIFRTKRHLMEVSTPVESPYEALRTYVNIIGAHIQARIDIPKIHLDGKELGK